MSKIRKAIVAGVGAGLSAGLGALITTLTNGGQVNEQSVAAALGVAIAAAIGAGRLVWRVPNAQP